MSQDAPRSLEEYEFGEYLYGILYGVTKEKVGKMGAELERGERSAKLLALHTT